MKLWHKVYKDLHSIRKSASRYKCALSEYCDIDGTVGHRCHYWSPLLAAPSLHILPISCATSTLNTTAKTPEIRGSESGLNWTKRAADCFCFYPLWVTISEHRQWSDSSCNTKPISTKVSGTRNSYFLRFLSRSGIIFIRDNETMTASRSEIAAVACVIAL